MEEEEEEEEEEQEDKQPIIPMKRRRGRPRLEKNAQKDNLEHWNEGIFILIVIKKILLIIINCYQYYFATLFHIKLFYNTFFYLSGKTVKCFVVFLLCFFFFNL